MEVYGPIFPKTNDGAGSKVTINSWAVISQGPLDVETREKNLY